MGHVRLPMHRFRMMSLLQEAVTETALPLSVIQLPYPRQRHLARNRIPAGTEHLPRYALLIQCLPQGFSSADVQCGLRIDEWVESFPKSKEMTGISFNYDQPNSMPLQSLLLAISPGGRRHWVWTDLVRTIRDTIETAKLRAVEPDMIDKVGRSNHPAAGRPWRSSAHAECDISRLLVNVKYVIDKAIALGFASAMIAK